MIDFLITYGLVIIVILFGIGWLVGYWMVELGVEQRSQAKPEYKPKEPEQGP